MKKQRIHKNSNGFTLVELMVAVAISAIVIVIVSWIYTEQQRVRNSQELVVDIQQNLRAAVSLIGQELRMAGYDPSNNAKASITAATSTSISFGKDVTGNGLPPPDEDGDGVLNDADENITLSFNPLHLNPLLRNTLTRQSTAAGVPQTLIQNVEQIEFRYTLQDGSITLAPNANQLKDIRSVDISMLVRGANRETGFFNSLTYTPASGVANNWGPYNDNFRRRMLITTIQCRNMGI